MLLFRYLGESCLLAIIWCVEIFRCATGENWPGIMLSCVKGQECDPNTGKEGKECGSNLAYMYFVSFIFFCSFLVSFVQFFFVCCYWIFFFRCWICSWLSSWIISTTWLGILQFWALTIWMSLLGYGPNTIPMLRKLLKLVFTLENSKCFYSGKIHFTEMYDMLKNMDPPLGFGNKCPNRLAYKKLIRMNMPVDDEGKVYFTTTLFALIRENLAIKMRAGKHLFSLLCSCKLKRFLQLMKWTRPTTNWGRPSRISGLYRPKIW